MPATKHFKFDKSPKNVNNKLYRSFITEFNGNLEYTYTKYQCVHYY